MEITIQRFHHLKDRTIGRLFIDNEDVCYTLEDAYHPEKIYGETRIHAGTYKLGFRKVGRMHGKYSKRFPDFHIGMIEVKNVPNYKYILIHCGNNPSDTAGCLIVGMRVSNDNKLINSCGAYKKVYKRISKALEAGEDVNIHYVNLNSEV